MDYGFTVQYSDSVHNVCTLNMAAWGSPSSWNGGLPVAISMIVQPKDQMSAGAP